MMIEWDVALALVIGAFGFGYGLASRGWRKDIERLFPPNTPPKLAERAERDLEEQPIPPLPPAQREVAFKRY